MGDRTVAGVGLALFLAAAAFPIWHAVGRAEGPAQPELELPEDASACVEDTEFMRANHMDLLNQWRHAVVRNGETEYASATGETFEMSLTATCMDCHGNRETFCKRCHDYANVEPPCWDCHVEPEGTGNG